MKHSNLTNKVMNLMLKEHQTLIDQFKIATIIEETNETGYFAHFSFQSVVPISNKIKLPEIIGKDKNGKAIVGFVLFISNGLIECLEGYTFGSQNWPHEDESISLEVVS